MDLSVAYRMIGRTCLLLKENPELAYKAHQLDVEFQKDVMAAYRKMKREYKKLFKPYEGKEAPKVIL